MIQDTQSTPESHANPSLDRLLLAASVALFSVVAVRNAWLGDDAYITLRTVRNIVDGYGPVWNVGERVQAYTHPLWMMLLTLFYFVTREAYYTTIFLSLALSIGTVAFVAWRVARTATGGVLAAVLLSLSKAFVDYSTSGLENPLSYLLLAIFFSLYVTPNRSARRIFWLSLLAALATVNRMDTLLLYAPALIYAIVATRSWRSVGAAALGFIPFVAWELFSLFYYGFPFPNTYYAKLNSTYPFIQIIQQGLLYLMDSLNSDPITLVTILLTALYVVIMRQWRLAIFLLGSLLYLVYLVRVGGDFMTGRFLSVPYLAAVLVLSVQALPPLNSPAPILLLAGAIALGFANPARAPWLSGTAYKDVEIDVRGIADERGYYYEQYGLLNSTRLNRFYESGTLQGSANPQDRLACAVGMRGFSASPATRIIDYCALADALLARLPPMHDPTWRIGHFLRTTPGGYWASVREDKNELTDPELSIYYDRLRTLIREDLWSWERLAEIWAFNTGRYDGLIDRERYQFPYAPVLEMPAPSTGTESVLVGSLFFDVDYFVKLLRQGLRFELPGVQHAGMIEVGSDAEVYDLVYYRDGVEVGRQPVTQPPLHTGRDHFTVTETPPQVQSAGYDAIRLIPQGSTENAFNYLNLIDDAKLVVAPDNASELRQLLHLAFYAFYRTQGARQDELLAALDAGITQAAPALWQEIDQATKVTIFTTPHPLFQKWVEPNLPESIVLVDPNKQPILRYIGAGPAENDTIDGRPALRLHLYFEVLSPPERDYSFWFEIKSPVVEGQAGPDAEYNVKTLYDELPPDGTTRWQAGSVYHYAPTFEVGTGAHELSTGLWTPGDRERLTVEGSDDYWINLGKVQAP
ncbi:MAG: hypothetical protein IPK16_02600 [Anaerolineales bacterium]|nr:hypothetical protein [Anaerolineales bacterium]